MKNTTIGVDPSVSSSSLTIDEVAANSANSGLTFNSPTPAEPYYGYIHASNVQQFMSQLLANALSLVDTSVPNRDQNKAMKHLLRKQFDKTIMDIHGMAWPSLGDPQKDKQSAAMSGAGMLANGYILQPEP